MYKEEFNNIFLKAKEITNSFKKFDASFIREYPQVIFVLRLILNLGQRTFAQLIHMDMRRLYSIERGKLIKMSLFATEKYIRCIKPHLKKIPLLEMTSELLYDRYMLFKVRGNLTTERAREIRSKNKPETALKRGLSTGTRILQENDFEKEIEIILIENNINFESHSVIKGKSKYFVVDFVIPDSKNPKFIVEVKQTKSKNVKTHYELIKSYAISLDHKMRNIKLNHPDIKCIIILSSKNRPLNILSPFINAEIIDSDKVFVDSDLKDLVNYIKE